MSYQKKIQRAMKGLTTAAATQVVIHKDRMYDAARRDGFDDKEATKLAYEAAITKALALKTK